LFASLKRSGRSNQAQAAYLKVIVREEEKQKAENHVVKVINNQGHTRRRGHESDQIEPEVHNEESRG